MPAISIKWSDSLVNTKCIRKENHSQLDLEVTSNPAAGLIRITIEADSRFLLGEKTHPEGI